MEPLTPSISVCRNCQFYHSEGRRGGHCKQLGAPVQGSWKSCSLAVSPFAPAWEALNPVKIWHSKPHIKEVGITHSSTLEALEACIQADAPVASSAMENPLKNDSFALKQ